MRRAERVVSDSEETKDEIKHVKDILRTDSYKNWVLQILARNKKPTKMNNPQEPPNKKYQWAFLIYQASLRNCKGSFGRMVSHLTINHRTPYDRFW